MAANLNISMVANNGGTSQKISMSTVTAASAALTGSFSLVTPDTTCFFRTADSGAVPTAVSDGTDQILIANNTYRVQHAPDAKLAFILAAGTGSVYITPES